MEFPCGESRSNYIVTVDGAVVWAFCFALSEFSCWFVIKIHSKKKLVKSSKRIFIKFTKNRTKPQKKQLAKKTPKLINWQNCFHHKKKKRN